MKSSGLVARLQIAILPLIAATLIRLIYHLSRREVLGEEVPREYWNRGERVLLPFWHDQLFLMVKGYRGSGARILISSSRDGELIARAMEIFGFGAVRGSSRRGARAAFRALVELGESPYDLAITPDGPKGPRHEIKDGIVELAKITGRPVIPLSLVCSRGIRFNSWDRFLLPLPFGRIVYAYGTALEMRAGEGREAFRERLIAAMAENEARAVACLEGYGCKAV